MTKMSSTYPAYGRAIAVTAAVFTVYGALFWWFVASIDRYARQPTKLLVTAFCWGAFAATWSMAIYGNSSLNSSSDRSGFRRSTRSAWTLPARVALKNHKYSNTNGISVLASLIG
ncbi:hypothetical protein [Nocardia asteroides]|uniref:hypothetical protein n=1 Tax=Nocardia asteroides TaxID=1824 RepID=UPI001E46E4AD|nr:hypothetical protein [Nocardia asteroides]UGT57033.1 hypothetical protein LTT85_09400 [Nocardia asteroides]